MKRHELEAIAFMWISEQEMVIDLYGGYPGELIKVRDKLVWFINSNGEKYDGPSLKVINFDKALIDAIKYIEKYEYFDEDISIQKNISEYQSSFGQDVKSLADYLENSDGSETYYYSPGNPYKDGAPALKLFKKAIG